MEPLQRVHSKTVVIASTNIDTDQIIPARFLTTTTKDGLGKQLFADWRYLADGAPNPAFILNRPEAAGCQVLVAGRNFHHRERRHGEMAVRESGRPSRHRSGRGAIDVAERCRDDLPHRSLRAPLPAPRHRRTRLPAQQARPDRKL